MRYSRDLKNIARREDAMRRLKEAHKRLFPEAPTPPEHAIWAIQEESEETVDSS